MNSNHGDGPSFLTSPPAMLTEHSLNSSWPIAIIHRRSHPPINSLPICSPFTAFPTIYHHLSLFLLTFPTIYHQLSLLSFTFPFPSLLAPSEMTTRRKNKLAHPAACVMTPAQLTAAGIPQPKRKQKRPTKDQRIAALEEDLRATRELLQTVRVSTLSTIQLYSHSLTLLHRAILLERAVLLARRRINSMMVWTQKSLPMTTNTSPSLAVVREPRSRLVV
jgi:hypothetical protein